MQIDLTANAAPVVVDNLRGAVRRVMRGTAGNAASLAAELAVAVAGRMLDDLTATEAVELAEAMRAVAALPKPSPLDVRLAADLDAAADLIELRAGTG